MVHERLFLTLYRSPFPRLDCPNIEPPPLPDPGQFLGGIAHWQPECCSLRHLNLPGGREVAWTGLLSAEEMCHDFIRGVPLGDQNVGGEDGVTRWLVGKSHG
jgi:hypothetical protein